MQPAHKRLIMLLSLTGLLLASSLERFRRPAEIGAGERGSGEWGCGSGMRFIASQPCHLGYAR